MSLHQLSFLLLLFLTILLGHSRPVASACDDANLCTFDWNEAATSADSSVPSCRHDPIPPPCISLGTLEQQSSAAAFSSFTEPALDLVLLISSSALKQNVATDSSSPTTSSRLHSFLTGFSQCTLPNFPTRNQSVYYSAVVYDTSDEDVLTVVQPLTDSFDSLRNKVEASISSTSTSMQASSSDSPTSATKRSVPAAVYHAIRQFIEKSSEKNADVKLHRPYAHQHFIILDGITSTPAPEQLDSLVKEQNNELSQLIQILSSPKLAISPSFALFYDAKNPFESASFGATGNMVSYASSPASSNIISHSHFNPSLTLRALIKDRTLPVSSQPGLRQDTSFVAQMLSRGVTARVWNVEVLDHQPSSSSIFSSLYESHYQHKLSHRPWCNSCDKWTCDPTTGWIRSDIICPTPSSQTCSRLHGCHTLLEKDAIAKSKQKENITEILAITSATGPSEKRVGYQEEKQLDLDITLDQLQPDALNPNTFSTSVPSSSSLPAGAPFPLFHITPYTEGTKRWLADHLTKSTPTTKTTSTDSKTEAPSPSSTPSSSPLHVPIYTWSPSRDFTEELISRGEACILRNTIVSEWPAMKKWAGVYLKEVYEKANLTFQQTKVSHSHKFFDPDRRTPLAIPLLLNLSLTYEEMDFSPSEMMEKLTEGGKKEFGVRQMKKEEEKTSTQSSSITPLHYYFGSLPSTLLPDITPYSKMFLNLDDLIKSKIFLWLSSADVNMHTHFDQDHNFFVQVSGKKRFTLVRPEHWREMYLFPRIHPLWHKSQVDADHPALHRFPDYHHITTYVADLEPGDVLYIPPYTWHQVESVTDSISLSIWSHDTNTVQAMEAIYRHDHKIDLLENEEGRRYALKLYIDLVIQEMYGKGMTNKFIAEMVKRRYASLKEVFREEVDEDDNSIETNDAGTRVQKPLCPIGQIPTARHVLGDATLDTAMNSATFLTLTPPSTRDILFLEYLEELTSSVVGPTRVLRFFIECFQEGQSYRFTQMESAEHQRLWKQN